MAPYAHESLSLSEKENFLGAVLFFLIISGLLVSYRTWLNYCGAGYSINYNGF